MTLEGILIGTVLAAAVLPLLTVKWLGTGAAIGTAAVLAVLMSTAVWLIGSDDTSTDEAAVVNRPIEVHTDGYVSSDTCRACHPQQYATWHDSYHRTMTQVASPEAVVGELRRVAA